MAQDFIILASTNVAKAEPTFRVIFWGCVRTFCMIVFALCILGMGLAAVNGKQSPDDDLPW